MASGELTKTSGELTKTSGELTKASIDEHSLPFGHVLTASGRVSGANFIGEPVPDAVPFDDIALARLDDTLTLATRRTKIRFSVYVGDLGTDTSAGADAVFPTIPEASNSVLIAVSPNAKAVEIRSGTAVAGRVDDSVAQLGITAATSSFREGDLIDGLVSAIRVMSAAILGPS